MVTPISDNRIKAMKLAAHATRFHSLETYRRNETLNYIGRPRENY